MIAYPFLSPCPVFSSSIFGVQFPKVMQKLTSLLLFFLPFISFAQESSEFAREWSGKALFYRRSSGGTGQNKNDVLYKMEIVFRNGIGTATASYSIDVRQVDKRSTYTESGSTTASERSEFSLSMTDDGKQYSAYLTVPACSGKLTVSRDGSSEIRDFGMDEALFQLEDKEVGDNPNILRGEEVSRTKHDGGGITEEVYQWVFVRNAVPVDLIIESPKYDGWLPVPGKDEDSHGNTIDVGLKLVSPTGKPLTVKAKYFEAKLVNTSAEPGIAINYPIDAPSNGKPDLCLLDDKGNRAPGDAQSLKVTAIDGKTGSLAIAAFDGGGFTTLEVTAFMEDGTQVTGHYLKPDGLSSVPYPKRNAGRLIAESWLTKYNNPNEYDDNEQTIANQNHGDGLSVFEEYRGVISEGKHLRLDPVKKEVGIRVKKEEVDLFRNGFALFASATNVIPVICYTTEMEESRKINRNGKTAKAGDQYGLYIENKDLGDGIGETVPGSNFKTTKITTGVYVNIARIRYVHQETLKRNGIPRLPYTVQEDIDNTVAHEIAHGIGIPHHGSSGQGVIYTKKESPNADIVFLLEDGKPSPVIPTLDQQLLGGQHNDASGDLNCIMAYTGKYQWAFTPESRKIIYRQVPFMPVGKKLCSSVAGTGINANGKYFGDAQSGYGNCLSVFKVKCY